MADERVKLGVELDFTSNLSDIQQKLKSIQDALEKDPLKLGLDKNSATEIKKETEQLSQIITNNFNKTSQKVDLSGVRKELNRSGISAAALGQKLELIGVNGEAAFKSISASAYTFDKKIKSSSALLNKFSTVLTNVTAYNAVSGIWNRVVGSIEQAIGFTKDLDRSLNDIRIVSGASADEMERFAKQANESAKALKTSTVEYSDAALVYFQQGMEADDVKKMTDATIMGANIVGESTEEMSELLTAVMNGYKLAADDAITVTDKLAAVGADTAADFYELATGMSKVASMANVAGVDLDSLNAQLATIVSVTKEAPETVGTSLKTIYGRMLAFKNNQTDLMTDDDGQLFDMPSVETALEKYSKATGTQISLFETAEDGTKTMRDLGGVIEDIGDAWDDTSNTAVKFGLATAIAGKLQQNRLVALFDSWDEYKKAVQTSLGAEGTTLEQNAIYMDSYAAHAKEMQSSMESLYMTLFQSDDMIGIVDVITAIVNGLTKITDLLNGMPGILGIIGGIVAKTAFSKQVTGIGNFITGKQTADTSADTIQYTGNTDKQLKLEEEYNRRLINIRKVYNKEAFEGIRKQVEEYVNLNREVEKQAAKVEFIKKNVEGLDKELNKIKKGGSITASVSKLNSKDEKTRNQGIGGIKNSLNSLETNYPTLMTDEVKAKLTDLRKDLDQSGMKAKDFKIAYKELIQTMADTHGLDIQQAELKELEAKLHAVSASVDETTKKQEQFALRTQKVRMAISSASTMLMSLVYAFNEESTASEKAASVLTTFGVTLLMQADVMSDKFIPALTKSIQNTVLLKDATLAATIAEQGLTLGAIKTAGALGVLKAVGIGLKAVFAEVILPLLAITAVVGGIIGVVKAVDARIVTTKEQKEKADEAAQSLEDINSKIETLTSSITSLEEQIAGLDPITDAGEISQLQEQLRLTKAQLAAEQELQKARELAASKESEEYLQKAYGGDTATGNNLTQKIENYDNGELLTKKLASKGIYDVKNLEQLSAKIEELETKRETAALSGDKAEQNRLQSKINGLKSIQEYYEGLNQDILENSNDFLVYYNNLTDEAKEKFRGTYQEIVDFLNSQDPSTFLTDIFNEEELTQAVEQIRNGVTDFSSIFNKHRTELNEAGVDYDKLVEYLQTYANQLVKTEEVEETAEQQFSNIINTIGLLGNQLDQGELDVEEYVTNVVANLNKLSNIDLSGVTGANDSLVSVLEDVQSALDVLNSKYASGEMKTEDYNDSVVEIIQQLKTLKTLFPQLSDAIDEMLSKDFNMDKFGVLVAADEVADQWAHVNDVLDSVSDEFSNLATVQEMVADGLTLTCDEVLKLAKLYPELLQNAVVASDGQMTLNQQVYDQFIKTRQGMLDATIEEQIGELEAQNVILENKKASLQSQLEAVREFNKGNLTLRQLSDKSIMTAANTLQEYLIQLGMDENDALAAIRLVEEGDYKEYAEKVKDYADDMALQMGKAIANVADDTKNNVTNMVESLNALGLMINKIATAWDNMVDGVTSDVSKVNVGGGGVTSKSSKSWSDVVANTTGAKTKNSGVFGSIVSPLDLANSNGNILEAKQKKNNTAASEKLYSLDDFIDEEKSQSILDKYFKDLDKNSQKFMQDLEESLQNSIASINNEIAQNKSAINALKSIGNYVKKGVFTKEDAKKVEEYTVKVEALRKELEKLEAIAAKIALLKSMIDSTDDSETKIALTKQLIELYKEEQNALHEANEAGRASIKEGLAALAKWGITSTYDPNTNSLSIDNWEDVNTLIKDEDQRKAAETIYNNVTSTNDANASRSQQWWTDRSNIQDEFDNWVTYKKEALDKEYAHESKLRDMDLKDFRQYYDECKAIYDEALAAGYLTAEEYADKLMTLGDDYGDKVKERIDDLIKYGQTTNTLTDDEELGLYEQGKEEILALYKEGKITYAKAKELILDYMDEIADKAEEIFDKSQTEIDRMIAKLETFSGTQLEVLDLYKQKMSEIEQEANAAYASGDMDRFNDLQADYYSTKSALMSATKSMLQTVVDAVVYELDEQIDKLNDEKDALETIYDLQDKLIDLKEEYATADGEDKDFLKEKIDYLEEQIQIYNNLETIEEKMLKAAEIEKELGEITLQQLKQKLELTKKTYTQRVWHEDTGWQWEADPTAVANAQKAVLSQEQNLAVLAIQDEIDALEDYKEKWQEVLEEYEHAQDVMIATAVLGEDWCNAVLSMETGLLDSFASYAVDMCTVVQSAVMSVWETFGSLSTGLEDLALETETATTSARELPDRFYNEDGSWNYNLNLSDEMINDPYGEGYTDYQKELINSIRIEKILNDPTVDQTKYGGDVNWTTYDEASENIKKRGYAAGGVVTETDLAMLHGSPDSPEIVFNAADSKKLYDLVHSSNNLVQDLGVSLPDLLGDITKVTPNFGSIINPSVAGTGLEGSAGSTTNDESMQFSNCSFNFETGAENIGELIQDIKIRIKNR